jgi:hypothetical protein
LKNTISILSLLLLFSMRGICQQYDTTQPQKFIIKKKDSCVATIAGLTGGAIGQVKLLEAGKIKLRDCKDCYITGFEMAIKQKNTGNCDTAKTPGPTVSKNEKFTTKMRVYIKDFPSDRCSETYVVFYNITYKGESGQVKKANDIILRIR